MTIQEYLEKVSIFVDDGFGRQVRQRFGDNLGSGELGILGSPSSDELDQLSRAVAIMTTYEKKNAISLTDEQIQQVAEDAKVDPGLLAIFINGYVLENR